MPAVILIRTVELYERLLYPHSECPAATYFITTLMGARQNPSGSLVFHSRQLGSMHAALFDEQPLPSLSPPSPAQPTDW
jgi:hypothetical protein